MTHDPHHEHIIKELAEQLQPVLSKSPQAIYLYLDDEHKICNQKFADMLGYKSVKEWEDNEYPLDDVAKEDQDKGVKAYMDASQNLKASSLKGNLIKKDGKKISVEIIMAPVSFKNEIFVIHFITEK